MPGLLRWLVDRPMAKEAHESRQKDAEQRRDINQWRQGQNKATAKREEIARHRSQVVKETADVIRSYQVGDIRGARSIFNRKGSALAKEGFFDTIAGKDAKGNATLRFLKKPVNPEMGNREPQIGRELNTKAQEQIVNMVYPKPKPLVLKKDEKAVDPNNPSKMLGSGYRSPVQPGYSVPVTGPKGSIRFAQAPRSNEPKVVAGDSRLIGPKGKMLRDIAGPRELAPKYSATDSTIYQSQGKGAGPKTATPVGRGKGREDGGSYWDYLKPGEKRQRLSAANRQIATSYGGGMDPFGRISLPPQNRTEAMMAMELQEYLQRTGIAPNHANAASTAMKFAKAAAAAGFSNIMDFFESRNGGMSTLPRKGSRQGLTPRPGGAPAGTDNTTLLRSLLQ